MIDLAEPNSIQGTEVKVFLSIIVPFFNVEKYIKECIHSLYSQDIPSDNYEVILVNDCSPDNSREIVVELQKEYPTLTLIDHDKNKKLGGARNSGLKVAKGDYIWFVDSDDFLKPNILNNLLEISYQNNLDVLHFDYYQYNENGEILEYPVTNETNVID